MGIDYWVYLGLFCKFETKIENDMSEFLWGGCVELKMTKCPNWGGWVGLSNMTMSSKSAFFKGLPLSTVAKT